MDEKTLLPTTGYTMGRCAELNQKATGVTLQAFKVHRHYGSGLPAKKHVY